MVKTNDESDLSLKCNSRKSDFAKAIV